MVASWMLLVLALTVQPTFCQTSNEKVRRVVFKSMTITGRSFSEPYLVKLARTIQIKHAGKGSIVVFKINTQEGQKIQRDDPMPREGVSLAQAEIASRAIALNRPELARVTFLGQRGVLDIRSQKGDLRHIVLGPYADPTVINIEDLRFRVVELRVRSHPMPNFPILYDSKDRDELDFYLQANRLPSPTDAVQLWKKLRSSSGFSNLHLCIRTIPWWDAASFPLMPDFERPEDIRYKNWREVPWVDIDSTAQGVDHTLFDGINNATTVIIPKLPR